MLVFFNDTATTEIYTLSLHDALPIFERRSRVALGHGFRLRADRRRVVGAGDRHRHRAGGGAVLARHRELGLNLLAGGELATWDVLTADPLTSCTASLPRKLSMAMERS